MISICQLPSAAPACVTASCLPEVKVAAARKFCLSTASKSRLSPSIARRGTACPPCTWASSLLPVGIRSVSAFSGRRNCGASPVYSGGVTQMSRLAAVIPDLPAISGLKDRTRRSFQSLPASIAPSSSRIASTARNPHGSRAANPACGSPIRSRRAAASMRRRCASHRLAAAPSSRPLGRSARACSGRCCSPLACSIRRRAEKASGMTVLPNAAAKPIAKAAPRPIRIAACKRPGKFGRTSNRPSTKNGTQRGQRRPARRPDPLPQQRKTGEPQPHREAAAG